MGEKKKQRHVIAEKLRALTSKLDSQALELYDHVYPMWTMWILVGRRKIDCIEQIVYEMRKTADDLLDACAEYKKNLEKKKEKPLPVNQSPLASPLLWELYERGKLTERINNLKAGDPIDIGQGRLAEIVDTDAIFTENRDRMVVLLVCDGSMEVQSFQEFVQHFIDENYKLCKRRVDD